MRVRELAIATAKSLCSSYEAQFLDDTVALSALGIGRDSAGQLRIRRVYQFDFSDSGNNRRKGYILMLGVRCEASRMETDERLH